MANYDVIIIGAGHNGLVAASYLAKAGRRVLVLERRGSVGGIAVTEEIFPGFHASPCADSPGYLCKEVKRDLKIGSRVEITRRASSAKANSRRMSVRSPPSGARRSKSSRR